MIETKQKILEKVVPLLEAHSLEKIKYLLKLDISVQTLSSWLSQDPPLMSPFYLAQYKCQKCKDSWRLWRIFYGRLQQKTCPNCEGPSLQSWRLPFPELFLQIEPNILWNGKPLPFNKIPFLHYQQKRKDLVLSKYPFYLDVPLSKRPRRLHIMFSQGDGGWLTRCRKSYTNDYARPLNSHDPVFSAMNVCKNCLENLIICRATPKDWAPISFKRPQHQTYMDFDLMMDVWLGNNVQSACDYRKLSRKDFYAACKRQPEFHYLLFLRGKT